MSGIRSPIRKSVSVRIAQAQNRASNQPSPVQDPSKGSLRGETSPVSVGLLSMHTTQAEAARNLEKKRRFAEVEGTQGQVILG